MTFVIVFIYQQQNCILLLVIIDIPPEILDSLAFT